MMWETIKRWATSLPGLGRIYRPAGRLVTENGEPLVTEQGPGIRVEP
jgi:hypothetical protein